MWFICVIHCVIVYLAHANDPTPLVCQGVWEGAILEAPTGEGGFGYDPIFYIPSCKKSAAQLTSAQKNSLSHRGAALQQLIVQLPLHWKQ